MRLQLIFISLVTFYAQCITAQTPITAVTITNTVSTTNTYTITTASQNYEGLSGQLGTYKWGVSPNNITVLMNNFTANGVTYAPNNQGQGSIIIRRVNNTNINYNRTVMWAESVRSGTNDPYAFDISPSYANTMESLIASRTLNRGADNVFTNASTSGSNTYSLNNIERVDYILDSPSALDVNQSGFTVFDRGGNDAFAVAVILGASGSAPTAYSNIIRVSASAFGAAPSGYNGNVTYRVYKGVPGTDLAESGRGDNNTQSMRGLYFKFSDFGIPAGTTIYGYSILPGDIPATATPAQIVNYQDAAIYPTNTLQNGGGGLDLVSVSGIFVNQALPVNFGAIKCNIVNKELIINWQTLKENNNQYFDVEVSADGVAFKRIARINSKATNGDSTSMLEYSYSTSISNVNGIVLGVASFLLLFAFSILGERRRRLTYFVPALLLCTILTGMYSCHKKDDRLNDSQKNIFVRIAQVDIDGNHFYSKVVKAIAE